MPTPSVLVACETSGQITQRLVKMGIDAVSCDVLPADDPTRSNHIVCDARELVREPWGMVIAHPPCTFLANSGVRWLYTKEGRWDDMREGAQFFLDMLNANSLLVAVENPVMHKHALEIIGRKHTFSMQPYEHGDPRTKRTCWWTVGLPKISPTNPCTKAQIQEARDSKEFQEVWRASPGPDRWKLRSRTYDGIADAVASVWGNFFLSSLGAPESPAGRKGENLPGQLELPLSESL